MERAATGVRNSEIKAYPPMDHRCDHLGQLLRDVSGVLLVDRERKQSERKRRIRSRSVAIRARAGARERIGGWG